jgi:hypothetical protein
MRFGLQMSRVDNQSKTVLIGTVLNWEIYIVVI